MNWRYDSEANVAYLRLSAAKVEESEEVRPGIVFDFDVQGRIVGIEVFDARSVLPEDTFAVVAAE